MGKNQPLGSLFVEKSWETYIWVIDILGFCGLYWLFLVTVINLQAWECLSPLHNVAVKTDLAFTATFVSKLSTRFSSAENRKAVSLRQIPRRNGKGWKTETMTWAMSHNKPHLNLKTSKYIPSATWVLVLHFARLARVKQAEHQAKRALKSSNTATQYQLMPQSVHMPCVLCHECDNDLSFLGLGCATPPFWATRIQ